jgi:IclR family transcriptional regulator, KDG regulon repressor
MPNWQKGATITQSVDLTLRILEKLAEQRGEKGVTQLAKELGTTKARIFRHLHTLRELGYVEQNNETQKDKVGMRLFLLSRLVGENMDLNRAVRPALETFRDQTNQTAVFAVVLDGKMTIVDFALGTMAVQFTFRPGATFNMNSAALGHISLAFGPSEYWQYVAVDEFEKETPKTSTDPAKLKARVDRARARGWTIVPEEALVGVNAIAAPVFSYDGAYAGAIAIVGSVQHIPANPPAELIEHALEAGRTASWNLGWRPNAER